MAVWGDMGLYLVNISSLLVQPFGLIREASCGEKYKLNSAETHNY
jgi:hypothetical protein